jgi:hypothetical protein
VTGQEIPAPRPGDIVTVDQRAAHYLQTPIRLRILLVQRSITYDGWAWLHGFELDATGRLGERRAVFVELAGLYRPPGTPPSPAPWRR